FWNLGGLAVLTNSFLYLLVACFVPVVFIVTPLRKPADAAATSAPPGPRRPGRPERRGVPWYDVALIALTLTVCGYFAANGVQIKEYGWEYVAPPLATVLSVVFWALILEVLRRSAGWVVAVVALVFSLYP